MAGALLTRRSLLAATAVAAGAFGLGWLGATRWRARRSAAPLANTRAVAHPAGAGARLPRLTAHPEGGFVASWVESDGGEHVLRCARRERGRWSAVSEVARGDRWFVNWLDFPSVVAVDRAFWVAHWLERRAGGRPYDYDIALAISGDAGRSWRRIGRPYRTAVAAEYGFVSLFADDGGAGVVWLDGRDYVSPSERHRHPERSGNFALRYTRVLRSGAIEPDRVLDDNVCTCCQTAAAVTADGPVVAYRGRTDGEVRDNKFMRRTGSVWSAAADLGAERWTIAACPTNGPALAARGRHLVAAWFTAAGDRPRVRAAVSVDAGATWSAPLELDGHAPIGRIGAAWIDRERAAVAWIAAPDETDGRAPLMVALLDDRGCERQRGSVARVASQRDSGLPQLAVDHGRLVVAWTEPAPHFGIRLIETQPVEVA